MATVRVAPSKVGRLAKVALADVPLDERRKASRSLRERRWRYELDPKQLGGDPPEAVKLGLLLEAVELERAAIFPRKEHLIPEAALIAWLAKRQ